MDPSQRFMEAYIFFCFAQRCERIFLMTLDTQQRDSHCFLDGFSSSSFSYRQNASLDLIFLSSNASVCSWVSFGFLYHHPVNGQFVQDNLSRFFDWFY